MTPLIKNDCETGEGENRQWQVNPGLVVYVKVAGIDPHMTTADVLYIKTAAGAVHKNAHSSKVCRYSIDWHSHGQCNAEINDDRTDTGIGIERFICITELVTVLAVKTFDRYIQRFLFVIDQQVRKLLFSRIITGKGAAACGAYGVSGEGDTVNCKDRILDDIGHNREYTGRFHAVRALPDSAISG